MFNLIIKLLVSKLHNLFLLVALTGFVCTYKIQAEEECLSHKIASNIYCYECDSRFDSNCADPFELESLSLAEQQTLAQANNSTLNSNNQQQELIASLQTRQQQINLNNNSTFRFKKMPNTMVCHGCCVKITSKTPEGVTYVKRTCTTNLQINYFMVGLVCMKESGDRGKMCFCEQDYCNGQMSNQRPTLSLLIGCLTLVCLLSMTKLMR